MSIDQELGFPNPIIRPAQEALINIVLTGEMLAKEVGRLLRPMGLTDSQFNILMLLKHQAEAGSINQTVLGGMLLVNRSNITGLIDRIEQSGWVERIADPNDRRVNRVRLTPSGRRLVDRAEKVYFKRIDEVMDTIAVKQRHLLCTHLETIRQQLRATP